MLWKKLYMTSAVWPSSLAYVLFLWPRVSFMCCDVRLLVMLVAVFIITSSSVLYWCICNWCAYCWVELYSEVSNRWLITTNVSWLCTDRLQPSETRQQSLAQPDQAQSGLSLQSTSPVLVAGAEGDTWATAAGAGAPVWGPHDAVGDVAQRQAGQPTLVVLTCLLCWKERVERKNIFWVHEAESCLKRKALMRTQRDRKFSTYAVWNEISLLRIVLKDVLKSVYFVTTQKEPKLFWWFTVAPCVRTPVDLNMAAGNTWKSSKYFSVFVQILAEIRWRCLCSLQSSYIWCFYSSWVLSCTY